MYHALDGADALVICTEWNDFRSPDFAEMARRMKGRTIFDGRNLYRSAQVTEAGFVYASVGRETVRP
jgi:UDPglucose 6-dehydrogenase